MKKIKRMKGDRKFLIRMFDVKTLPGNVLTIDCNNSHRLIIVGLETEELDEKGEEFKWKFAGKQSKIT